MVHDLSCRDTINDLVRPSIFPNLFPSDDFTECSMSHLNRFAADHTVHVHDLREVNSDTRRPLRGLGCTEFLLIRWYDWVSAQVRHLFHV